VRKVDDKRIRYMDADVEMEGGRLYLYLYERVTRARETDGEIGSYHDLHSN
jgi:hypothetical protein